MCLNLPNKINTGISSACSSDRPCQLSLTRGQCLKHHALPYQNTQATVQNSSPNNMACCRSGDKPCQWSHTSEQSQGHHIVNLSKYSGYCAKRLLEQHGLTPFWRQAMSIESHQRTMPAASYHYPIKILRFLCETAPWTWLGPILATSHVSRVTPADNADGIIPLPFQNTQATVWNGSYQSGTM